MVARYNEMRRKHEAEVTELLDQIVTRATGRAVMSDIKGRSGFSVTILPFEFNARDHTDGAGIAATTTSLQIPMFEGDDPRTRPEKAVRAKGRPGGRNADDFGTGGAADVYFTASRVRNRRRHGHPDEMLMHELVHASRYIKGSVPHFR